MVFSTMFVKAMSFFNRNRLKTIIIGLTAFVLGFTAFLANTTTIVANIRSISGEKESRFEKQLVTSSSPFFSDYAYISVNSVDKALKYSWLRQVFEGSGVVLTTNSKYKDLAAFLITASHQMSASKYINDGYTISLSSQVTVEDRKTKKTCFSGGAKIKSFGFTKDEAKSKAFGVLDAKFYDMIQRSSQRC